MNDNRINKSDKYEKLQKRIQNAQSKQNTSNEAIYSDKYSHLKQLLVFNITKIQNDTMTVVMPNRQKPELLKDLNKVHCEIAGIFRNKDFEFEVNEISKKCPYISMKDHNILSVTFVKNSEPGIRFIAEFSIPSFYPWCEIRCSTRVLIGNPKKIGRIIQKECNNIGYVRHPILQICKKIWEKMENESEFS